MTQEVIQDFLNLPGIAGLALIDKRSRPYFCGIDQALNYQQKETLAQGILQVIDTIPDGFESFKFQFANYQVHIHKLDPGMILLVLTKSGLVYSEYKQTIKTLTITLRENMAGAIATFRMLAGTTTLPGLNHSKASSIQKRTPAKTSSPSSLSSSVSTEVETAPTESDRPGFVQPAAPPADVPIKDLLIALNTFSQVTTQYLGIHVVVNYWKSTRPSHEWLKQFQIERSGQFSLVNATTESLQHSVSPQELLWIQEWVASFITRCSQVIRDFSSLINQKVLTNEQKALLLG
ncbi:hypothetical protein JOY44_05590 [Phormidium sp. CLA17]|uniref:hypothetical protein n=1 Tax=Leptolyngbya sp. Cla-17 TaxID=2803751 RepID=UPI0014912645|nr:hypothetical protein [Leptolyngbya sp. Cla-17]MBM0741094.1 hypothetical protein [Leptolyngbya sp. Cla-17]